jgi:hypothetical protein
MNIEYLFAIVVLVFVVVLSLMRRTPDLPKEEFINLFVSKPVLWFLVDDYAINANYVQLALQSANSTQGSDFTIVPVWGRDALLGLLKNPLFDAKQLSPNLWRLYAIANLLESRGGLVMDGASTLCVGPSLYPSVKGYSTATFGIHPAEAIVSPATAVAPGPAPYVAWAQQEGSLVWSQAAEIYRSLVLRGPQAWSAAEARHIELEVWDIQKRAGAAIIRSVDGGRLANGQLRQLEDLFGRVAEPADPKNALLQENAYVSYNGDDLARRHEYNWFLRLSVDQIKQSDLVWTRFAGY